MTAEEMRQRFPAQTQALEEALEHANQRARQGDYALHSSRGLVLETLVDPILTAVGFGPETRSYEVNHPSRCWLRAAGNTIALIICVPLEEIRQTNPSVRMFRERTGFGGPITFTNGVQWRTHEGYGSRRVRDYHNGQTASFAPLMEAGQGNRNRTG